MARSTGLTVPLTTIAKAAGVSVATVSKVLNGHTDVAEATRARVQATLAEQGQSRGRPRRRATHRIDLRVENLEGIWSEELIRGVVSTAESHGLDVVISIGAKGSDHHAWITHALQRGTDGIIVVVSVPDDADRARISNAGIPLVLVDPWQFPEDTLSIGVTNWQGGLDATAHLIGCGHRRIGTITGSLELKNALARLGGYRSALLEAGIEADDALIHHGDYSAAAGYSGAQYFMSLPDPPTAIFAASDDCALGAMHAYREAGWRVPSDISIVGFDDVPTARWSEPALTTVRQPLEQAGATAVDTLVKARAGVNLARRMELATTLVIRESTAVRKSESEE